MPSRGVHLVAVACLLGALIALAGGTPAAFAGDVLASHWFRRAPFVLASTAVVLVGGTHLARWSCRTWSVAPATTDRERHVRMFALSFAGLLLELALIRWIGAEVRAFGYFKNFVLIAAFTGFGLGFALGARTQRLFPASLVGVAALALLVAIWNDVSLYPAVGSEEQTWGHGVAPRAASIALVLGVFLLSVAVFFYALCGTFAALVQEMGALFVELPRLPAYATNLAGSLAGVLAFNALSWAETPPPVWFAAALLPLGLLAGGPGLRMLWVGAAVSSMLVVAAVDGRQTGRDVLHAWSPYYRVSAGPYEVPLPGGLPSAAEYSASVNRELMTVASLQDPALYRARHGRALPVSTYDLPFLLKPDAKRILVLASGLGNDVAAAVRVGRPERVVAVELDPCIARFGRLLHPERPFDDPRVELVIDDARHHVQTTRERYDLVLMSFLDSHTLLSAYSQLRTDNFLYTREAFARVRELLAPGGLFVCTYASDRPWLVARLQAALRAAFDQEPLAGGEGHVFLAVGPGLPARGALHPVVAAWLEARPLRPAPAGQDHPTDDRPFLTLSGRDLPAAYWVSIIVVMALTGLSLRAAGLPLARIDPLLLALGAAFLLAETRLITLAGLLFGVTWQAYGVAISLVLATLIGGTLAAARVPDRARPLLYGLLLAALVGSHLAPLEAMTRLEGPARLLASLVVFGPTFFLAAVVFAQELRRVPEAAVPAALASNLLGSVAGGLLEYQSVLAGVGSLTFTALALYALSGLLSLRRR